MKTEVIRKDTTMPAKRLWRWLIGAGGAALLLALVGAWFLYFRPPRSEGIDTELTRLAAMDLFAGTVLIAQGDEILFLKGYGLADRENRVPFTPDTISSTGSITKQFTAAAILKLKEAGKLRLTDTLAQYFEDVPGDKANITIHQLLTHSSGLPHSLGQDEDWIGREELLRAAWSAELLAAPGAKYEYSNVGYSILAALVEMLSDQKYEEFLHTHFFEPLGMRETGYWIPRWDMARVAKGYRGNFVYGSVLEKQDPERGFSWHLVGNGGIHSTAKDMYRWFRALRNHRVLSEASTAELFGEHIDEGDGDSFYGYGWVTFKLPLGLKMVGHNGGNGYLFEDLNFFPQRGDLFYYLMVNDQAQSEAVSERIARRLFGQNLPLPPEIHRVAPPEIEALTGEYVLPSGQRVRVAQFGNVLELEALSIRAHAEVFASKAASTEQLMEMTSAVEEIVQGILRGDLRPLHQAYEGRVELAELEKIYGDRLRDLQAEYGTVQSKTVLGTQPRSGGGFMTVFRIECERQSLHFAYVWRDGSLRGFSVLPQVPRMLFYPVAPHTFESFSLRGAERNRLVFLHDPQENLSFELEKNGERIKGSKDCPPGHG